MGPGAECYSKTILRVHFQGTVKQCNGFWILVRAVRPEMRQGAHDEVVGCQIVGLFLWARSTSAWRAEG